MNYQQKEFYSAIGKNRLATVKTMLLDEKFDASYKDNLFIQLAISLDHHKIVLELLKNKKVILSKKINLSKSINLQNKSNLPIVDFTYYNLFNYSCIQGRYEIAKYLLEEIKIPIDIDHIQGLKLAIYNKYYNIVELILKQKLNFYNEEEFFIYLNLDKKNIDIFIKLITHPNFDITINNNWAIRYAAENGIVELVELLLQNPKVNPADLNNFAITYSDINEHTEVTRLLWKNTKVKNTLATSNRKLYDMIKKEELSNNIKNF